MVFVLAMISQTDLNDINEKLALYFGVELDGRPRYRVVWANDQREKRCGEFNEFYGPLFLRTAFGVKEVPKYPQFKDRYILERLLFGPGLKEIIDSDKGIYEAIWWFVDKDGNYLPPNLQVCTIIIRHLEAPKEKRTEKDDIRDEDKARQKEIEYFTDYLNDVGPSVLFYPSETGKQGVFIDSTKQRK